jgi:hypothetical protein
MSASPQPAAFLLEHAACVICGYEGAECICLELVEVPRFEDDGGVEKL